MDIPVFSGPGAAAPVCTGGETAGAADSSAVPDEEKAGEKKVIRTLIKKHIRITDAEIGTETSIKDGKITIDKNIIEKALKEDPLCKKIELDVIKTG